MCAEIEKKTIWKKRDCKTLDAFQLITIHSISMKIELYECKFAIWDSVALNLLNKLNLTFTRQQFNNNKQTNKQTTKQNYTQRNIGYDFECKPFLFSTYLNKNIRQMQFTEFFYQKFIFDQIFNKNHD